MRDPNDFTASLATVIASLEERVRNGVEQPDSVTVIFKTSVTSYELPRPGYAITRVSGLRGGQFTVFQPGVHFRFSANRVVWVNEAERPDEGSRLDIEFTYRETPSGLTDFNPGSVVGTLLRAVAREITLLYAQMDQAYRRAFIDQATGVALDNVVALLGVVRNPALKATGTVTFARRRPATQTVVIPVGVRVADQSGRLFVTTQEGRIPPVAPDELARPVGTRVRTRDKIASVVGVWRRGDDPETAPSLAFAPDFGEDERGITLTAPPPPGELLIRYHPKSVTVAIEALDAGPNGNVNAGTITLMPTPPVGVDEVGNEVPTDGGEDAEPDERLRERAKHALERAGNATPDAIRFAVLDVDGVQDVEVLDHASDEAIPLGEVRVRYSGGDRTEVVRVIEQTRAAGVMARVEEIIEVLISGTFFLIPAQQPSADAVGTFLGEVAEAIQVLAIGAPLGVRRLNALVFTIPGLADVAEAQLRFRRPDPTNPTQTIEGDVTDPFLVSRSERVRPDRDRLSAVLLRALQTSADRVGTGGVAHVIDLQVVDGAGVPAQFRSVTLDVQVTLRVSLTARPDQPPERIGTFTRAVQFTNGDTGALNILLADLAGLRPEHVDTVEFLIAAAAHPSLAPTVRSVDVRP